MGSQNFQLLFMMKSLDPVIVNSVSQGLPVSIAVENCTSNFCTKLIVIGGELMLPYLFWPVVGKVTVIKLLRYVTSYLFK